jgi:hypothetical protein
VEIDIYAAAKLPEEADPPSLDHNPVTLELLARLVLNDAKQPSEV